MIDPTVAQQLEMLNRTGALAAAFLAGWVCCLISLWTGLRSMRRIRQHRLASRMGPPKGSYGIRLDECRGQRRELLFFGEPVGLDEGPVQRGNGSGGPTTPKPDIVPKPQYPGGYISLDGAQPFRVRGRLQPLPDELDAYTYQRGPQGDTPNPPPSDRRD